MTKGRSGLVRFDVAIYVLVADCGMLAAAVAESGGVDVVLRAGEVANMTHW